MRSGASLAVVQPSFGRGADMAPHIERSWRRCRALGVREQAAAPMPRGDLADRRESAALLWRSAQPELDALRDLLGAPHEGVALLADAGGLVLDASDGGPLCGTDWSEAARGTNAIGTVLHERTALQVMGAEHFLPCFSALGGVAAPVLDGRGAVTGVLALSGPASNIDDAHALGWVRMAAAQVEHRMLCRSGASMLVHFHRRPDLLGTAREGLLVVEDGHVVGINRVAHTLLGGDGAAWLDQPVAQVLGARWLRLIDAPGLVSAPDGMPWAVTVDGPRPQRERSGGTHSRSRSKPPPIRARAAPLQARPEAPLPTGVPVPRIAQLQRDAMQVALKQHNGHVAPAARSLGVSRSTLYRWLQAHRPRA